MHSKDRKVVTFRSGLVWVVWVIAVAGFILNLAGCDNDEPENFKPPVVNPEIGKAQHWLTTGDQSQLLSRQPDISITGPASTILPVITINPDQTFQRMEGFGAALTGSSAFLMSKELSTAQRQTLIDELFDPVSTLR